MLFKTIPELLTVLGLLEPYEFFYLLLYLFKKASSFYIKIEKGALDGGRYKLNALEFLDYSTLKEYSCRMDSAIFDFYCLFACLFRNICCSAVSTILGYLIKVF